jgi:aminoglycoside phosphotransferase (APT) family kinase protein
MQHDEQTGASAPYAWAAAALEAADGAALPAGYYNRNVVVERDGATYLVRAPIAGAPTLDIRLTPEALVLPLLAAQGFPAPRLLFRDPAGRFAVHSYIPGRSLDTLFPVRAPLPEWVAPAMGAQFAQLHSLDPSPFAPVCGMLAPDRDCAALLRAAVSYTERFYRESAGRHARLFAHLGFPPDPLAPVRAEAHRLVPQPFVVCHCDAHRRNLIIAPDAETLTMIDWELATLADPAYDLALHLHKVRYAPHQEAAFLEAYAGVRGAAPAPDQIAIYRRHEQLRSALIDVVRVVVDLRLPGMTRDMQLALASHYLPKLLRAWEIWGIEGDPALRAPAGLLQLLLDGALR